MYTLRGIVAVRTTLVFKAGNSSATLAPQKNFQLTGEGAEIFKRNNELVIQGSPKNLSGAFQLLTQLLDDFFEEGRKDDVPQERESF